MPSAKTKELALSVLAVILLVGISVGAAHLMAHMMPAALQPNLLTLVLVAALLPVVLMLVLLGRSFRLRAGPLDLAVDQPLPAGSLPGLGDDAEADIPFIDPGQLLGPWGGVDPAALDRWSFTPGVLRLVAGEVAQTDEQLRAIVEAFGAHGLRSVLFLAKDGGFLGQMTPHRFRNLLLEDRKAKAKPFLDALRAGDVGRMRHLDLVRSSLEEGSTLKEAARHLAEHRLRTGILVDAENRPVKVLDQDVLHAHLLRRVAGA